MSVLSGQVSALSCDKCQFCEVSVLLSATVLTSVSVIKCQSVDKYQFYEVSVLPGQVSGYDKCQFCEVSVLLSATVLTCVSSVKQPMLSSRCQVSVLFVKFLYGLDVQHIVLCVQCVCVCVCVCTVLTVQYVYAILTV